MTVVAPRSVDAAIGQVPEKVPVIIQEQVFLKRYARGIFDTVVDQPAVMQVLPVGHFGRRVVSQRGPAGRLP